MPFREAHPSGKESGFPTISSNSEADEKRLRLGWRKSPAMRSKSGGCGLLCHRSIAVVSIPDALDQISAASEAQAMRSSGSSKTSTGTS